MKRRLAPLAGGACVLVLIAASSAQAVVTTSPFAAACFAARRGCRVTVDPFTLQVSIGQRLASFQIGLGTSTVYDFHTDQSNPPSGSYTPTIPRLGFAARCNTSFAARLSAQGSGDVAPVILAETTPIVCPVPEPGALAQGAGAVLALAAGRAGRRLARRDARADAVRKISCDPMHRWE